MQDQDSSSDQGMMKIDERDKLFKEMGIFLTKEDLDSFNLELRKMQE